MGHIARLPGHTVVVEDHDLVRARLMSWLAARGHRVRACAGGDLTVLDEALDDETADNLVVLDLCLGEHDGVDVLQHLAERRFCGDVILISAASDAILDTARAIGRDLGLNVLGGLRKPLALDRLESLIGTAAPEMTPTGRRRSGAAASLAAALAAGRIRHLAQPVFDLRTLKPVSLELLARLDDGSAAGPTSIAPLLDGASPAVLADLALASVDAAATLIDALARRGLAPLPLSINVPAALIERRRLSRLIERHAARGLTLTLEVSERDPFGDVAEARRAATSAALKGWRFSLDDFGTINSNIDRLMQLPFNEVKIDRAFVQGLARDPFADVVCRYAVRLARMRGALVVAEGVEAQTDLDHLRALGVDRVQGYLLCPALSVEDLVQHLSDASADSDGNDRGTPALVGGAGPEGPIGDLPTGAPAFADRLAALKLRFLDRSAQDAVAIRSLRDRLRHGEPLEGEVLRQLTHTAHGLSGAAGIFGFEAVSDAAHRVETVLRGFAERPTDIDGPLDVLEGELAALAVAHPA